MKFLTTYYKNCGKLGIQNGQIPSGPKSSYIAQFSSSELPNKSAFRGKYCSIAYTYK
jgi:hypothetical protein